MHTYVYIRILSNQENADQFKVSFCDECKPLGKNPNHRLIQWRECLTTKHFVLSTGQWSCCLQISVPIEVVAVIRHGVRNSWALRLALSEVIKSLVCVPGPSPLPLLPLNNGQDIKKAESSPETFTWHNIFYEAIMYLNLVLSFQFQRVSTHHRRSDFNEVPHHWPEGLCTVKDDLHAALQPP